MNLSSCPRAKPAPPNPKNASSWAGTAAQPSSLRELNNYVPRGSSAMVVADPNVSAEVADVENVIKQECSRFANQKVSFKRGDTTDRRLLETIRTADYDHVIALSYAGLDIQEADAKTLILSLINISEPTRL